MNTEKRWWYFQQEQWHLFNGRVTRKKQQWYCIFNSNIETKSNQKNKTSLNMTGEVYTSRSHIGKECILTTK